jgi:polyphosphate kinase
MTRNLDFRSEVAVPIYDADIQEEIRSIINVQLKDNTKARVIGGMKENEYVKTRSVSAVVAQNEIRKYLQKLSGIKAPAKRN